MDRQSDRWLRVSTEKSWRSVSAVESVVSMVSMVSVVSSAQSSAPQPESSHAHCVASTADTTVAILCRFDKTIQMRFTSILLVLWSQNKSYKQWNRFLSIVVVKHNSLDLIILANNRDEWAHYGPTPSPLWLPMNCYNNQINYWTGVSKTIKNRFIMVNSWGWPFLSISNLRIWELFEIKYISKNYV